MEAMRRATAIAATTLALGGCGAAPPAADHAAAPRQEPPRAGAPLPRAAPALARRLSASSAGLTQAIGAWSDRAHTQPPAPVALYALDQQRILRALAGQPRLAAQVERRLRPGLRKFTHEV